MLGDVEPKEMRRIEVPLGIKLDRPHLVIQVAMRWINSHSWVFEEGGVHWGDADMIEDFGDEPLAVSKSTVLSVMEKFRNEDDPLRLLR